MTQSIVLGEIGLSVQSLTTSIAFYQNIIGLDLIKRVDSNAQLGLNDRVFITLYEDINYKAPLTNHTGLYHIALLVPSEKDLGKVLIHFAQNGVHIDGAGDHLYSQAIYLHDPDGHGIEIYADRPRSEWHINKDNTIITDTGPVDLNRLIELGKDESWQGLPHGTSLGHIHLSVDNLDAFKAFYIDTLGFDLKTNWANRAYFVSKDGYHHHIGANIWMNPQPPSTGLRYYTLHLDNYLDMKPKLHKYSSFQDHGEFLTLTDPHDIQIMIKPLTPYQPNPSTVYTISKEDTL